LDHQNTNLHFGIRSPEEFQSLFSGEEQLYSMFIARIRLLQAESLSAP
jgi:hypothetical protein